VQQRSRAHRGAFDPGLVDSGSQALPMVREREFVE